MDEGLCGDDAGLSAPPDERLVESGVAAFANTQLMAMSQACGLHATPVRLSAAGPGTAATNIKIGLRGVDCFARHKFFVVVRNGVYDPDKCLRIRDAFLRTDWSYTCGGQRLLYASVCAGQVLTECLSDEAEDVLPGALHNAPVKDWAMHDARDDVPYNKDEDVLLEFPTLLCLSLGRLHSASPQGVFWQNVTMTGFCGRSYLDATAVLEGVPMFMGARALYMSWSGRDYKYEGTPSLTANSTLPHPFVGGVGTEDVHFCATAENPTCLCIELQSSESPAPELHSLTCTKGDVQVVIHAADAVRTALHATFSVYVFLMDELVTTLPSAIRSVHALPNNAGRVRVDCVSLFSHGAPGTCRLTFVSRALASVREGLLSRATAKAGQGADN